MKKKHLGRYFDEFFREENISEKTQKNTDKKVKKRLKSLIKPKRLDCIATDKCKINFEQEIR